MDLEALGDAAVAVADAALVDAHVGKTGERRLVAERPADRLGEPIDALLVVLGDGGQGIAGSPHQFGGEGPLLGGDVASHALPQSVGRCERCSPGE